jgi:long-chain-fatty-acid---luciferin-component ligase
VSTIPVAAERLAAPATARLHLRVLEGQDPIDHLLFNEDDLFRLPEPERRRLSLPLVRQAAVHYHALCPPYRRLCEAEGFAPDDLVTAGDLARVPLVPAGAFKRHSLVCGDGSEVVKRCLSSGTQGTRSEVPRDNTTLERFVGSVQSIAKDVVGLPFRGQVLNLGPDTDEAADLWFAYVMSVLELIYPARHFVRDGAFRVADLTDALRDAEPDERLLLVGPPPLFLQFAEYVERHGPGRPLAGADCVLVTAGGWKRASAEAIEPAELRARLCETLGIEDAARIRDAFNMVELNTVLIECAAHRKHAPPWLVATARDPRTLAPLPSGETGVLAYLDPTPTSYPGFVLSEDFGSIHTEPCACGRTAPTVKIERRVKRIESRGCALKMDHSICVEKEAA